MRAHHDHLTNQELLMAVDREWSRRDQARVEQHIAQCEACRARQRTIEDTLRDSTALYQEGQRPVAAAEAFARERLQTRMRAAARDAARQGIRFGLRLGLRFGLGPRSMAVAAMVVLGIVLLRLPRPDGAAPRMVPNADLPDRPIARLTPGATWDLSLAELCDGGAREQREVPAAVRQQVLRDYHMERLSPDEYKLDYLITPELGGAPDARNLWPERYTSGVWNARVKDQLEELLPQLVCKRQLSLAVAQQDIAVDWIAASRKYFHTQTPLRVQASLDNDSVDGPGIRYPVWRDWAPAPRLISFPPPDGCTSHRRQKGSS